MPSPKKIPIGKRLTQFPANSFNALVDAELRRRGDTGPRVPQALGPDRSSVIVRLKYVSTNPLAGVDPVGPGRCVVLNGSMLDPSINDSAPFSGLQFTCTVPSADSTGTHFAITMSPMVMDSIGYGHIPQACWAEVDVVDELHTHAAITEDSTLLTSAEQGRFPIIWKESGEGQKWAIIRLQDNGVSTLKWGKVTTAITAATAAGTWGAGNVQFWFSDGSNDGSPVAVENWYPATFPLNAGICCDTNFDPPRVVGGTCEAFP